jgi:alpha-ketoglutarate-dependent 2,4-dichlorophenoxyacetate dioxygenase
MPTETPFVRRRLSPALGAELGGVDFAQPAEALPVRALYEALLKHQLLLFRGQEVPPAAQVAIARGFGEVQVHVMNQYHADGYPELYRLSNADAHGRPSGRHPDRGTLAWHTDGSWMRRTGQATMLYAEVVPADSGGTEWCDMYGAYQALDAATRAQLGGMRAIHNLDFSRSRRHGEEPMTEEQRRAVPPVDHPIVRTHPDTGRKAIFLGDHAESIVGMDYAQGRQFIEALNARIVRPERVYSHRWQACDFVIWDNRCTLHRALEYDTAQALRIIRRCTVLGEVPA